MHRVLDFAYHAFDKTIWYGAAAGFPEYHAMKAVSFRFRPM